MLLCATVPLREHHIEILQVYALAPLEPFASGFLKTIVMDTVKSHIVQKANGALHPLPVDLTYLGAAKIVLQALEKLEVVIHLHKQVDRRALEPLPQIVENHPAVAIVRENREVFTCQPLPVLQVDMLVQELPNLLAVHNPRHPSLIATRRT